MNGKKKKIKKKDFSIAMKTSGMNEKSIENVFEKFEKLQHKWHFFIDLSFLPNEFKESYHRMIIENLTN
ncbi:MAG: serine/threonine-protein kinase HipA [Dokdonia sp.]|jgi:serine/threonine-protein kinase HipA